MITTDYMVNSYLFRYAICEHMSAIHWAHGLFHEAVDYYLKSERELADAVGWASR